MTEETTEIIATYPIYKPFRRINYNFKKQLQNDLMMLHPTTWAKILPRFLGRFTGRKYDPVVEELNQFVYLSMESEEDTYQIVENREEVERNINSTYDDFAEKTLNKLKKVIRDDPEFVASFKAIDVIAKKTDAVLKTEILQLKDLAKNVVEQIDILFKNSQMILWDLPGSQIDRIIIGSEVTNVSEVAEFDIGSVADELALTSLAKHHIPLLKEQVQTIHESISQLPSLLVEFKAGFANFKNKRERDYVLELASIFLGKLLGIREPVSLSQKLLNRYHRLKEDIAEEAREARSDYLFHLYNDLINEEDISHILKLTEEIMDFIGQNSDSIRKLYNSIEEATPTGKSPTSLQSFSQYVAKIYYELEEFRFITEVFQDVPSFTSMGGGTAIASSGDEKVVTMPDGDWIIYSENIFKTFPLPTTTVYALRGIDLKVKQGEFIAIMGPSGSGKTTLLNILSGIEEPDRGSVFVADLDLIHASEKELVAFRRDTVAFIYQAYNLLPNLKNKENVQLPADLGTNKDIGKKSQRSVQLLEDVGLGDYPNGFPLRLSGGQQQRVTIARALMNKPDIIFADEPTGDLDTITGGQILDVLNQFHDEGVTVVVVTHDKRVAARADRIIHMLDGKIIPKEQAKL